MKLSQIAAQLYTVRDFCRNAADLAATAGKIRAIGYEAVQLSGLGPIPKDEIVRIMAGEIHLKDYAMTRERRPTFCEIGQGTLPFQRIIAEAEQSGCRWFVVEQDTCPNNPFASLQISFDYLKTNLVS